MKSNLAFTLASLLIALGPAHVVGQTKEDQVVNAATVVLQEVMSVPAKRIPQTLLANAEGVAIIPNVVKGGFIVGIRHGKGVMLVRDESGAWHAPLFIELTGGSVGWQAGVQATDVILVFKSRKSVDGIMNGTFTIGADASVAAGPVGREAAAATDAKLQAEIYSYSRSRGLFAGVSLGGSALKIDQAAGAAYYGTPAAVGEGDVPVIPASSVRLINQLVQFTARPAMEQQLTLSSPPGAGQQETARKQQLANASSRLFALLDEKWKAYLALPAAVFEPSSEAPLDQLVAALERYNKVYVDPQFTTLSQHAEFIETRRLLQEYLELRSADTPTTLTLPQPPK